MNAPALRDIQEAVVAWHNRQALAVRIDESQVHSIGWVALPFLRQPQGVEPSLDAPSAAPSSFGEASLASQPWHRRWLSRSRGASSGPARVFSEAFIDGLSASRAASFAVLHGTSEAPPSDEGAWPQRRIDVDSTLAETSAGGWPVEFWLISAAIDVGKERRRVLISADGRSVAGPRHWRRSLIQALSGAAAGVCIAVGVLTWHLNRPAADPTHQPIAPVATSASAPASQAASSATATSAPLASSAPSAASAQLAASGLPTPTSQGPGASQPASAPATANPASSAEAGPPPNNQVAEGPPPDIRPLLVKPLPNRRGTAPAPMLSTLKDAPTSSASASSAAMSTGQPKTDEEASDTRSATSSVYRGTDSPESLRPGASKQGPLIALVSPGLKTQAEAESMLKRMTEHLRITMAQDAGLRGEVIQSPEGWRAAVYPFATREEAAILNATMVARGWRTRSVTF